MIAPSPMTWPEYRDHYLAVERRHDDELRTGTGALDGTGYRYVGPPMIPTAERHIRAAWRSHVEAFEHAMATRWACRVDAWMHPRDVVRAGLAEAVAIASMSSAMVDVTTLMAMLFDL